MEGKAVKIYNKNNPKISLKIIPGHFATNHSHINYYFDMTTLKIRQNEANAVAIAIAGEYIHSTIVDTIVCMDGTDIIGAYLAEELTKAGIMSMNAHETLYIVTPEVSTKGKMIFRDNIKSALFQKHVVLLVASATTGETVEKCIECIRYYGGMVAGVSAIFSAISKVADISVKSLFTLKDLPDYKTYKYTNCPFCKENIKLDAIVTTNGYSKI